MRRCREAHNLSVERLARRSGISYAMIWAMEADQRNPSLVTLEALADTLGVGIDEYIGWDEVKGRNDGKS